MKKGLVIIIFLFNGCAVFGQSNYLVYQLRGDVMETAGKAHKLLRIGQLLKNNAVLWLNKGSGITLICENYSGFSVNTAGRYELGKHQQICNQEDYSITAEYFKFIWEELTHPHESPEDNRRKYMQNEGAVVRGCPGIFIDHVFDNINLCHGAVSISWETNLSTDRLLFALYEDENNGEAIFSTHVKENAISFDTIKKHAGNREDIYWGITVDGNEICPRKCIRVWPENNYGLFLDSIKKLLPVSINKAEWNYMAGFFLEVNFFISEAFNFYQQAAIMNPALERYRLTVDDLKKKLKKK